MGTENYLTFTDYSISSDYSVWPYEDIVEEEGVLVEDLTSKYSFQTNAQSGKYISFYFAKDSNSLVINRSVQKMTELFAFIEGTVVAFITLFFILK